MKALDSIERFVFHSAAWKLILIIQLIMLFKTGVWFIPNLSSSLAMAQNPFTNPYPDPNAHYLCWIWISAFLGWVVGIKETWSFFLLHLLFSISFTVLFIRTAFVRLQGREARVSLILFSLLPVSATAYFWVSYDSITLFLMMAALAFPGRLFLPLMFGIIIGMQRFGQAFFAYAGVLFAIYCSKFYKTRVEFTLQWALGLLIGAICGKLMLVAMFSYLGVSVNSGNLYRQLHGEFLPQATGLFYHFHYAVFSVLGLGWIVLIKYFDKKKDAIPFLIPFFALLLLLIPVGDKTRVLAIVTFPLVASFWILNKDFLASLSDRLVAWLLLLWCIVPWAWVWGEPKWSAFPYDIAYVIHELFGWFSVPVELRMWPFN